MLIELSKIQISLHILTLFGVSLCTHIESNYVEISIPVLEIMAFFSNMAFT